MDFQRELFPEKYRNIEILSTELLADNKWMVPFILQ
jgi:hypothetical protein